MTRLQKKCLIAAAGAHLLVVVVVLCSGFIVSRPKADETQLLTVIPSNAIDKLLSSGEQNAPPPQPAPPVKPVDPTPPTPPAPEPPKPVVTPPPRPAVEPLPQPTPPQENPEIEIPQPKPPKRQIQVDLNPVVRDPRQAADDSAAVAAKAERIAREQARQRERAFQKALNTISRNASSAVEVSLPGNSSASYANYGAIVVSTYHNAWVSPDSMTSDTAMVGFSVTIARDGTVISAHIVSASGESNVDNAVRRMLERVNFIHEFPADSTDQERTYHIDFNATRTNLQ